MNPKSISKFQNTKDWTFVKDGLDDFRDGLPPPAHDSDIIQVRLEMSSGQVQVLLTH